MSESITVGINTRNRPEALAITIYSIINQTYPHWSLTIFDCNDEPLEKFECARKMVELARGLGHRVVVVRQPGFSGIPQTYQRMMEMSDTEFNVREEDDAPWHPEFLQSLYEEMEKRPSVGAAGPMCANWDAAGKNHSLYPGENYFFVTHNHGWRQQMGPVLMADDVQRRPWKPVDPIPVCVLHGGFMYRKSHLVKAGGFCSNLSPQGHREETWASFRLFLSGSDLLFVPKAVRWHLELQTGGSRDLAVRADRMTLKMEDEKLFQSWVKEVLESGDPRLSQVPIFSDDSLMERINPQQALAMLTEHGV